MTTRETDAHIQRIAQVFSFTLLTLFSWYILWVRVTWMALLVLSFITFMIRGTNCSYYERNRGKNQEWYNAARTSLIYFITAALMFYFQR